PLWPGAASFTPSKSYGRSASIRIIGIASTSTSIDGATVTTTFNQRVEWGTTAADVLGGTGSQCTGTLTSGNAGVPGGPSGGDTGDSTADESGPTREYEWSG